MMKKCIFYKIVLSFAGIASLGNTAHSLKTDFSGFYVGVVSGYNLTTDTCQESYDSQQSVTPLPLFLDATTKRKIHSSSGRFGFIAGWGMHVTDHVYAGLELTHFTNHHKLGPIPGNDHVHPLYEMKQKGSTELALRLGYPFGRVLPYVKVGLERTVFQVHFRNNEHRLSKPLNSLVLGAGADIPITSNTLFKIGYTYINRKKWKHQIQGTDWESSDSGDWDSFDSSDFTRPDAHYVNASKAHTLFFGVVYRF